VSIRILAPGFQTTVQDRGRSGWRALGVGQSGAADGPALRLGNQLVGNGDDDAGLELTLLGPRLRFLDHSFFVLTGSDIVAELGGRSIPMRRPVWARAGSELTLGACQTGARSYLCMAGGVDVPPVLGSRSTDVTGRLGGLLGRPLQAGDVLPIGSGDSARWRPGAAIPDDGEPFRLARFFVQENAHSYLTAHGSAIVRVTLGSHAAELDARARAEFFATEWQLTPESSRMGVRLDGAWRLQEPLGELVSEPLVPGTVQLPPGGRPIVLGVEAPTTGGYPRVAQVIAADLPLLGQLRPADKLRFSVVDLDAAHAAWRLQEDRLLRIALGLKLRAE